MTHPVALQMLDQVAARLAQEVGEEAPETRRTYEWEDDWEAWLDRMFPVSYSSPFASHHAEFWAWVWSLKLGVTPDPFIGIWSRAGGKSSSAEGAVVAVGTRGIRRYGLYIRATQDLADTSVGNVASMLESATVERYYPAHAERLLSKFGSPKGWRRNRIRTAGGFTVDALGLDVASRGVKVEDQRPDFMIFDDVDELHDSPLATRKKIDTITKSLLPAGARVGCAVVGIQNLIIPHGVFSQLADGRAPFLVKRKVSGPHPAVKGLKTKMKTVKGKRMAVIVGGTPVWKGQDLVACQDLMDLIGLPAFQQECQHNVHEREGALWTKDMIKYVDKIPQLKRAAVGCDPSGGTAEIGIIGAGVGYDGKGYVFCDETQPGDLGARNWGITLVDVYDEYELDKILGERNYGGDMVEANVKAAAGQRRVAFEFVNASRGKTIRAEPVSAMYEQEEVLHVGQFPELEIEMTGWVQGDPWSPNRLDALVHVLTWLLLGKRKGGMRWGTQAKRK